MNEKEFRKLIDSIGFNDNTVSNYCKYKKYRIDLYNTYYHFYNGSEWIDNIRYNDLTTIKEHFKKEFRSIKLKTLLR